MKLAAILFLSLLSIPAFTQEAEIETLRNQFQNLKFDVEADRNSGFELIEKVHVRLQKFHAGKMNSKEEFRQLVLLAGAALPFDTETESAEQIEAMIREKKALRQVYDTALASIKDHCRRQLLASVVTERACLEDAQLAKKKMTPTTCVVKPVFTYESCIGMKTEE